MSTTTDLRDEIEALTREVSITYAAKIAGVPEAAELYRRAEASLKTAEAEALRLFFERGQELVIVWRIARRRALGVRG